MKKEIKKDSLEWKMFADLFTLYKEYGEIEMDSDEYWNSLIQAFGTFGKKYEGVGTLSKKLAIAVVGALEDESNAKRIAMVNANSNEDFV